MSFRFFSKTRHIYANLKGVPVLCAASVLSRTFGFKDDSKPQPALALAPVKAKMKSQELRLPKIPSTLLAWGYGFASSPEGVGVFQDKKIAKVCFSERLQCVLCEDGSLFLQLDEKGWEKENTPQCTNPRDVHVNDHSVYIINKDGTTLYQYIYDNTTYEKYHSSKFEQNSIQQVKKKEEQDSISPPNNKEAWYTTSLPSNTLQELKVSRTSPSRHNTLIEGSNNTIISSNKMNKEYKWNKNDKLVKVACNNRRVFAITEQGNVYVQGQNEHGECGIVQIENKGEGFHIKKPDYISKFEMIPSKYFDAKVTDIATGVNHSLFLTESGRLFTCGADNFMQLGLGWTKRRCYEIDGPWTELGLKGFDATIEAFESDIKMDSSDRYMHEVPPHDEHVPRVVLGPYFTHYRVLSIDSGDYHSAAIVEPLPSVSNFRRGENVSTNISKIQRGRRVITWGSGLRGQLGHSNFTNAVEPHVVSSLSQVKEYNEEEKAEVNMIPLQVACGKEHTLVLMQGYSEETKYVVYAFGNNQHRQLAIKSKVKLANPYLIDCLVPKMFPITKIAAGHNQSAAFM